MKKLLFAATYTVISLLHGHNASAEELSIHGSTTVYANIYQAHQATIEQKAGVKLNVVANGSGRGLTDLVDGKANIAMISASLDTTIESVNKKEPGRIAAGLLVAHPVGQTEVAFIVHNSNSVKNLSLEQIKGILLGSITNWNQVGGDNKPIVVISEDSKGGIRTLVEEKLLEKKTIAASGKKEVPNGSQVAKIAGQLPVAFGVASPASLDSNVKRVQTDQNIAQPLILVTKGTPTASMQKVIENTAAVIK